MMLVENNKIQVEIGRQCIADFLGSDKISKFIWAIQWPKMFGELCGEFREPGSRCEPVVVTRTLLACAIHTIEKYGYWSKTKCEETGEYSLQTSSNAAYMYNGDRWAGVAPYRPTETEVAEADKIIEYIKTLDTNSDYNFNLVKIANSEYCGYRFIGYLVSMVPTYRRAMDLIRAKEAKKPSEYVGQVGDRTNFVLTYRGFNSWMSHYGTTYLNRFTDSDDNIFIWKTNNENDFEEGKVYSIVASVKEHKEYKDIKQTIITRAKIK